MRRSQPATSTVLLAAVDRVCRGNPVSGRGEDEPHGSPLIQIRTCVYACGSYEAWMERKRAFGSLLRTSAPQP